MTKLAAAVSAVLIFVLLGSDSLSTSTPLQIASAAGPASDEFNGASLDPAWTFVNPLGDGSVAVTGTQAAITVPGGVNHDVWSNGVNAARIMRPVDDTDFEIEVKFDSDITELYQLQGILVEANANNVLRFGTYSTGSGRRNLFAAHVNAAAGTVSAFSNLAISVSAPIYLKVDRVGDTWTYSYSEDGQSWIVGVTFSRAFAVASAGVYSGNLGNPTHTVLVDYFHFNGPTPTGSVATQVTGSGSVTKSPDLASYSVGDVVQLTATPSAGWVFGSWTGDLTGSANPANLTVTGAMNVTAVFVDDPNTHTLDVTTTGSGVAAKSPDQPLYTTGDIVQLTAIPDPGWVFDSWSGGASSSQNPVNVTVSGNLNVVATFIPDPNVHIISLSTTGAGTASKSPDQSTYSTGDIVQLTATPATGWVFDSWTGDLVSSGNPANVTVGGDLNITAVFVDDPNTHTVTVNSAGSGSVSKQPDQQLYATGAIVQLTATPTSGWDFDSWSGDLTGNLNPANVAVTGDMNITTTFTNPVFTGDEFDGGSLDPAWTFVDPLGDGSVAVTGTQAAITVPGGVNHDVWSNGVNAARIMRPVDDTDFEIEVKFDSDITQLYQLQGILVEANANNVLRFGTYSSGSGRRNLFAAHVNAAAGTVSSFSNLAISVSAPIYLKVDRVGDTWTYSYSDDGQSWIVGVTFNRAFAVASAGVYSGNVGNPTHTALVDYFHFDGPTPAATVTTNVTGSGSVTKNPDLASYSVGDVVQLTATPSAGWVLGSWTGDLTGSTNPANLTVTGDMNVTAVFVDDPNTHTLNLATTGSGVAAKSPDQSLYTTGDIVQLTATPDPGWVFDSWSGGASSSQNPVNVTVNSDLSINATFVPNPNVHVVTISTTGSGTASKSPDQPTYSTGDIVQLTATPATGWVFDSWTGDLVSSSNPVNVTISGDMNTTAVFIPDPNIHTITLATSGSGTAGKSPDSPTYTTGDVVQLTATPDLGWAFQSWTGDLVSTTNPVNVTVTSDMNVTAVFVGDPNTHTVTLNAVGSGSVSKSPDQQFYSTGDVVQLTATPGASWLFTSWSGGVTGTTNPVNITVTADLNVTATFVSPFFTGDEFNTGSLDPGWTFVDPLGDSTVGVTGTQVEITVPGGVTHDVWSNGVNAARIMHAVEDGDFELEVKFDSDISQLYQLQGILIEAETDNVLRLGTYSNGGGRRNLFAAQVNAATGTVSIFSNTLISVSAPIYLKVNRTGSDWIYSYSDDGANWTTGASFTSAFSTSAVGVYSGNVGTPTHTATVDYIRYSGPIPQGTVSTLTTGSGSVTKSPDQASYDVTSIVELTAIPDAGWVFDSWAGDFSGTSNPANVAVIGDMVITAVFVDDPNTHKITLATSGSGSASKSPDQSTYDDGDAVQLSATPDAGWIFDSWIGDLTSLSNPVNVTVTSDMNVTAVFVDDPNTHSVTLATSGSGTASKSPDLSLYSTGDVVQLTAIPDAGWIFSLWSGDLTGSTNPVNVTVASELNITAVFVDDPSTHALTLATTGLGSVSKSPDQEFYATGAVVQLTAVPAGPGWEFNSWSGDLTGSTNPINVTVNGDMSITAIFNTVSLGETVFDIFYGDVQEFNNIGRPQVWASVLGNASDPDGLSSLTYTLNGGASQNLSIGSDGRRLWSVGDFNVELDFDDLVVGMNEIIITATDANSNVSQKTVFVDYAGRNVWPINYSIDWSTVTNIQDAVQIIDGDWTLGPDGLTTIGNSGYDRLFGIGDLDWTDYAIEFDVTVHGATQNHGAFGLAMRWRGHTNTPFCTVQPHCGWVPYGHGMFYAWSPSGGVSTDFEGDTSLQDSSGLIILPDVTYTFKLEVENLPDGTTIARKKVWETGQPEPSGWLKEGNNSKHLMLDGSFLFVAHHVELTVGDITVSPLVP